MKLIVLVLMLLLACPIQGQVQIFAADASADTLAPAVFSYPEGSYPDQIKVKITAGKGAKIYYTTNGKNPSKASKLYKEPIVITKTTTLKAIAYKDKRKSEVQTIVYTIKNRALHKTITYEWKDKSSTWVYDIEISKADLKKFKNKSNLNKDGINYDYAAYVKDPEDDEFIKEIAESFRTAAKNANYSKEQLIDMLISFVQSMKYVSDLESKGQIEYPKYPIETLYDKKGDCEDFCILLSSLLNALDIDNLLLIFPEHMAVGIAGNYSGSYYRYNGLNYYYIETTEPGWKPGELPVPYKTADILLVK